MSARLLQKDELVRQHALHGDEIANLSASCINELQVVLSAIVEMSKANPVIHDLAKIGAALAQEHAALILLTNTTGKERIEMECATQGGADA